MEDIMANNIRSFYDSEIALMEHDLIGESEMLEWRPEDAQFYLQGVHDFANKIIKKIREREGF
jgi:hypothetical protein